VGQVGEPYTQTAKDFSTLREDFGCGSRESEDLMSASLFDFGGEASPLLGPQAVDERVDEG